ncbi:MAG: type 1 glutamine amidotransferase [Natronospirillum sp.]|uniref:gamma-glutamyl-gamma-aminobutyrate hydrolase family protein n=1 Tax=Natronospirillum sp. TaxID=2812955 RepID=UPI0025D4DFF1|nr:type 1 glutamine amidotransferase [Natronospirillum sp.]MCH8552103.1 type 1 glutamine amidotransferase [Natronospirillum sp.]
MARQPLNNSVRDDPRPLIAVTGPRRGAFGPRSCVALGLWLAGGRPVQVRPGELSAQWPWQGVVITGGHDVDPVLYAAEPEVKPRYDNERDAFETQMIQQCMSRGTPVLGICRGSQLLNVALGGTLFQDIRPRRPRRANRRSLLPVRTIRAAAGSRLAKELGVTRCRVNNLHSQAIDRVASTFNAVAWDRDDIIQGVEYGGEDRFIMGVQWHPEFLLYQPRQRALFRALITASRRTTDHPPTNQS